MRATLTAALLCALFAAAAPAQEATVAAPTGGFARYDPTLSAREAVLANWDLAASGIRAGEVLGRRVVAAADDGVPHARLAGLAQSSERTMVQRWNAVQWIAAAEPGLAGLDGALLRDAVEAAGAPCAAEPCAEEAAALRAAFSAAADAMASVAAEARAAIDARRDAGDAALLAEQLRAVADYLEGGAWAEGLVLAAEGRDREEVAARLVGAMTLWRNVEPYVGLRDPAVDADINAAVETLLRTLRLGERQPGPLKPDGPELGALRVAAQALAAEFRRASALFSA